MAPPRSPRKVSPRIAKEASVAEAPNIGATLGQRLQRVGIETVGQLEALGDEGAFARVTEIFPDEASVHTRLALAGAVRGVRVTKLSKVLRARLTAKVTGKSRARPAKGLSFEQVKALAATLPGVELSNAYGAPALKVKGRLLLRLREDGKTVVVKSTLEDRARLLEADPRAYFITEHYRHYPWLVVRLSAVRENAMKDLLQSAWQVVAPEAFLLGPASSGSDTGGEVSGVGGRPRPTPSS